MATYTTKYNIGDEVYFVDYDAMAPVGPAKITEITLCDSEGKLTIRYHFCRTSRHEDAVFSHVNDALLACRNPDWNLAQMRA